VEHIEAGLRCGNAQMPEEINRRLTDHLAEVCYAPTPSAAANLLREGLSPRQVIETGDIMYEAFQRFGPQTAELQAAEPRFDLVVTLHREENTASAARLGRIVRELTVLAKETRIVFPLHPRTRKALEQDGLLETLGARVTLCDPCPYRQMLRLLGGARVVLTDSGTLQREAIFLGVPSLTLRSESEWPELLASGWNELLEPEQIVAVTRTRLEASVPFGKSLKPQLTLSDARRPSDCILSQWLGMVP
jgi:UDP-GlcNAc3NAcA epimerase